MNLSGESPKKVNHPVPFPRELPKRCIKLFSFVNEIIFDPFAGSGSTLIEAINNKRYALGLEIDNNYIKNSLVRIEKECLFTTFEVFDDKVLPENKHAIKEHNRN